MALILAKKRAFPAHKCDNPACDNLTTRQYYCSDRCCHLVCDRGRKRDKKNPHHFCKKCGCYLTGIQYLCFSCRQIPKKSKRKFPLVSKFCICGKEFQQRCYTQKYCSSKCKYRASIGTQYKKDYVKRYQPRRNYRYQFDEQFRNKILKTVKARGKRLRVIIHAMQEMFDFSNIKPPGLAWFHNVSKDDYLDYQGMMFCKKYYSHSLRETKRARSKLNEEQLFIYHHFDKECRTMREENTIDEATYRERQKQRCEYERLIVVAYNEMFNIKEIGNGTDAN